MKIRKLKYTKSGEHILQSLILKRKITLCVKLVRILNLMIGILIAAKIKCSIDRLRYKLETKILDMRTELKEKLKE